MRIRFLNFCIDIKQYNIYSTIYGIEIKQDIYNSKPLKNIK